jgi:Gpi18-like mannosyltransferase
MPHEGHFLDMTVWSHWIDYMQKHGIRHVYDMHTRPGPGEIPGFIYGPVYMYLLYFWGKWQGSIEVIEQSIFQFKSVILIFDLIGIWFALRFLRHAESRPYLALFLIFNAGLLYDTVGWGQCDSIITTMVFVAVYYGLRGQLAVSGICLLIALLVKPQPIIFLPALGLLWLPLVVKNKLRYTALSLLAVVLAGMFLLAPFLLEGTAIDYLTMLSHSASLYPSVSIKAANMWQLVLTDDPYKVSDQVVRFGLTYKQWGLLLFTTVYAIVIFPMMRQTYQLIRGQRAHYDKAVVLLTFALTPVVFYFFNTQMHERYAQPCILFLAAYAFVKGDFVPYVIASVANFWVLEKGVFLMKLDRLYQLISLEHLAILFLIVLVWGTVQLYKKSTPVTTDVPLPVIDTKSV